MATILSVGDIAIVHYNSETDAFTFVFLRDVEAGTIVNFTDNGWLAAGGFRPGEDTVTYTAPSAITAGTIVTLSGLDLDAAGDQIIAYQGDPATPTILHLVDFGDGNNTVAGDATDANTTALPPGFTLGVNAVAVAFDQSLYAGPTSGSPAGLFAALNNSANWFAGDTPPVGLVANKKPDVDLDSNDSTHSGLDYETTVELGGPAVPITDIDIAIDDNDGFDIFAAEIKINAKDSRDLLTVNGSLPAGILATAYDPAKGILKLEGQASHADYETAIRQVEFSTTDAPNQTKVILVVVYDGKGWSKDGTAFIHVSLPAAPPALDLDANDSTTGGADATTTYTAGGAAQSITDADVRITDVDSTTIQSARINILDYSLESGDVLSIVGTLPTGITASSYDPFTGTLTLSGPASLADYQTALHQVVYSNTLSAPSIADRSIQVTVNDGALNSNAATMFMHVVVPPPNLAPVLNLDANSSTTPGTNYLTGFTEGAAPVAIVDTDVLAFDRDSPNLASATITLTNPQTGDVLTFDGTPPAGIDVSGSGTSVIMLTGVALSGSYRTALQQIKFSNTSIDPSNVTRSIEVVVSDGASNSNTAAAIVQVEAVNNSAPVIDLDPDDSGGSFRTTFRTIFTENGAPIAIADTDTTITDLDSTTLVFATITLANRQPGDLLTAILPLPDGIVASAYDPATGVLTLTGLATLDAYEAALRQVLYGSTSDNPVTEDRLIEVLANDGENISNVAAALIGVVAVNDAPAIHVDTAAFYVENAAASVLSPLAIVADVDDTELNDLVVRITGGGIAGDGDTLTVGSLTSGTINGITFEWHPADQALVLTGASLVANYQDLLRTVAFHSTSDNPTDFNESTARTLTWSVSGGTAVTIATTTLDIVALNDAPQATVVATASYTENAGPVVLSPASIVTDVDNINLTTGEVRIVSGAVGGDLLTVNGLQSGAFSGIEFSYDPVLHSLKFAHPTDVASYETFLKAIEFSSTSDNPTDSGLSPTRTLSWFVFDGDALSDVQTTVVSITAVADPPVNTVPGAQSVNEDTTLPIAGVSVADADSATLTATLSVVHGTLNVTTGGGATIGGNGSGTVTIGGTAAQINSALAALSYHGNLNFTGADTLTITTSDGALNDIDTVPITVNAVNDPPVNTVPGPLSVNEDTTLPIGVSVADVDSAALTTTLSVTNGTLTVAAGGSALITGSGTNSLVISGTAAQINNALGTLGYRGNLNFNGADTLTVTTSDGALSDTDTVPITVNAVNDAPVNTVPGAQSVAEDTTLAIAGVSVADVDSTALTATLTVVNGTLNVTTGGGATIGGNGSGTVTISGTAAQINSALAALSYHGNLNFNGADTLTITTSDGALNDIDTVPITVNAVNDPPVNAVPGAQTVAEDTTLLIPGLSIADVDDTVLTTTLTVASGTLTIPLRGGGLITGSGTNSLVINGTATQINNALATLHYRGNLDFNGSDTLTVTTSDGSLSDTDTVPITVNAVNDAPVNTVPGPQTVAEDTTLPIAGVSAADLDSTTLTTTLSVTNGTLNVTTGGGAVIAGDGTATVTISGTAAQINNALAGLSYLGNLDFHGSDTLTVATSDGSLSDIDVVGIAVGAAGDPPVNTVPGPQTVDEDTVLPIAGVSVADVDNTVLTTTLGVANGTLDVTGTGVSGSGTATVTITGSPTQINAALATLGYRGNPDFNGSDTLTVSTFDGSLTDTDTVAITVNPVNDPPANTVPGAQSVNEDTALPIAGVSVADVDSTALTATLTVAHGTLSATDTGVSGSGSATLTIVGTDAEINAALGTVSYLGAPNFHGSDTLTVVTSDGSLSDTDTVPITVQAVNDVPANTVPPAQTVDEDTVLPIAGLSVADVDSPVLHTTLSVAHGTLTATGAGAGARLAASATNTVEILGTAAEINAALGALTYLGDPDFNGADTLTVTTLDGALNDTDTVPITVNAVDDPPVNTVPGTLSVNEDTTLPIGVSVADVDSAALTTTLSVANGTLTVKTGGGATIGGNGTGSVTIGGTATQINSALAGLSYRGNLNFNGADTLTVATSDGQFTDTDTVAITVNPVDDAPVNTVPGPQIANEDTVLPIAGLSVVDTDSPLLLTTLTVAHGTLTATGAGISGSGTATLTITGTGTEVNAALGTLSYLANLDFNGADTLTVTTSDGSSSDTDTVPITVNALNDPPVNAVPGARSFNEDTTLSIGGVSVADVDSPSLVTTLTVAHGTLSATGAGVAGSGTATLTISGSATQINTALGTLSYRGNLDFSGLDTLTVSTSDGALTDTDTVAIIVLAVNDPPVNTVPGAQSVNEDSTLAIDGVSVADVDGATLATILSVTSGILTVGAGGAISNNGTGTVTISGSAAQVNASLATLSYLGHLDFNGPDTLTVTTSDGALTDAATVAITVNPVNDAPVNTVPGPQIANEDTVLPIVGLSVVDTDSPLLLTTLTVAHGTLTATGTGISGSGTATLTITGTAVNAALGTLSYRGNLNLNGPDTLTVTTGDGVAQDIDTVAITVNPVNDPPALPPPKILRVNEDTTLLIPGVSVSDVDSLSLTTVMEVTDGIINVTAGTGATVGGNGTAAITITGTVPQTNAALAGLSYRGNLNFNGEDILFLVTRDEAFERGIPILIIVDPVNDRPVLDLDANNSSGAAGADYTTSFTEGGTAVAVADLDDLVADVDNSNLAFATVTLANHQPLDLLSITGTLPAGITASAYDPSTGVLTLSGPATPAAYQTALRQVVFGNSSPTPSATDRIVNIVVNDGAAGSVAAHAFVHVVPLDTAPVLDLDADDSSGVAGEDYTAVFTAGGAAVPVADTDTRVADADSPSLVSATIKLTNGEATDRLSVNGMLPAGIASAFDSLTGTLTLTGPASRADYQTALRQIEYDSSEPNVSTATRVIEVVVNDGSTDSNAAFSVIRISLEAPPTLDLDGDDSTAGGTDYATAFTEDGAAVRIVDADIVFSAPALRSATITLTNLLPGDLLSVSGALPPGITHVYDPGTGVLTLTGPGTRESYETAADQIVYSNSSDDPSTDNRIITVVVNDGINDSNTATAIVDVVAVDDPPSLAVATAASYTENDPAVLVSPAAAVSDPDSPNLTIGVVAITAGLTPGDVLTVSGLRSGALGSIKFDWAPSLNELIVTGTGSPGDYQALFQSVRFHSDSDDPTNGGADTTRTISWAVFDGTNTAVSTTTLTIGALNDAPVAQDVSAAGDEDKPIAGTLVATDTDGITLTYSLAAPATHGSVVVTPDGSYTYTPAADFNGSDSFTFVANDGETDSNIATVTLTVSPVSDRPPGQGPGGNPVPTPGFDAGYYLATNPDVAEAGVDPLEHFNTFGWREGRNPSASFDTVYYLAQNPDVAAAGVNPLDHFNVFGWREGRDPNAYFDTSGYLEHYTDVAAAGVNPLQHYEEFGWHEGRDPSLAFDTTQYLAVYTDVAAAHVEPLGHFLYFGVREGRSPFGDGFWE